MFKGIFKGVFAPEKRSDEVNDFADSITRVLLERFEPSEVKTIHTRITKNLVSDYLKRIEKLEAEKLEIEKVKNL